ncbi:MAG: tRNA (guanosine(46)-N7)-methyltransferase TrmB [Planctomycetota bacterium]
MRSTYLAAKLLFGQGLERTQAKHDDAAVLTIADVMVEAPSDGGVADPMSWFAEPGPFELEIGCGKGGFLLHRARANPELRFLGIEWKNEYFRYTADRMARWAIRNVRVMRTDAAHFVRAQLPADCVSILHLYHPDPWPKKRHHKRRLVQPDFVRAVSRCLLPSGLWLIQSDHAEYFQQIEEAIGANLVFRRIPWDDAWNEAGADDDWSGTNFEIKYRREGRAIHRAAYELLADRQATADSVGIG